MANWQWGPQRQAGAGSVGLTFRLTAEDPNAGTNSLSTCAAPCASPAGDAGQIPLGRGTPTARSPSVSAASRPTGRQVR